MSAEAIVRDLWVQYYNEIYGKETPMAIQAAAGHLDSWPSYIVAVRAYKLGLANREVVNAQA